MSLPVRLSSVQRTLLFTVYLRALESRSPTSILRDPMAERVVERLDFDFGRFGIDRGDARMSLRAVPIDRQVRHFCALHPDGVVVHLGCGLDSRVWRVDPPATVGWFDVDYPEVIGLRTVLFPRRPGCRTIAADVTDRTWMDQLPDDRPAMIVAEGLSMYLSEAQLRDLIVRLMDHFSGGEIIFDALTPLGARLYSAHRTFRVTGATIRSTMPDPRAPESWDPRLHLIAERSIVGEPEAALTARRTRLVCALMYALPPLRHVLRTLHFGFSPAGEGR